MRQAEFCFGRIMHFLQKSIFVTPLTFSGRFWKGGRRLGGLWGTPFHQNSYYFIGFVCICRSRVCLCQILQKCGFSRNLILTLVRSISVSFDEALFGCLVTVVSPRILLLTEVICRFVTHRLFLQFFLNMSLFP